MNELPRVMIGGPIRDREWSAPGWLDALLSLDYPRELLTLAVLVNDSRDGTEACCRWWAGRALDAGFGAARVRVEDFGTTTDNNVRAGRDYAAFAQARDAWVAMRSEQEWLLQVDSDIQVPSDLLRRLLVEAGGTRSEAQPLTSCAARTESGPLPMVAAVVANHHASALEWYTNVLVEEQVPAPGGGWQTGYAHENTAWRDFGPGVRRCDLTGACVLLNRTLFDAPPRGYGLRYYHPEMDAHGWNEDQVFCEALRSHGVCPAYAPAVRATHWMTAPVDQTYLTDPDWHERLGEYHLARARALRGRA